MTVVKEPDGASVYFSFEEEAGKLRKLAVKNSNRGLSPTTTFNLFGYTVTSRDPFVVRCLFWMSMLVVVAGAFSLHLLEGQVATPTKNKNCSRSERKRVRC